MGGERLRVRVSGGYTVHNLGHQDAVAGGGSLAALGEIDWCGPVESFEETSLSSVRVTRDVNAGEVLLVQRPLKGTATGLHVLSRTAAVQLRLSAPGPDSLLARHVSAGAQVSSHWRGSRDVFFGSVLLVFWLVGALGYEPFCSSCAFL